VSEDELASWPTVLADIARVIGRESALKLGAKFGGLDHVRIPQRPTETHLWASVLTREEWEAIVERFGGQYIDLPRGTYIALRKAEIIHLAQMGGLTHRQIALRVHVGERYVRRVLTTEDVPAHEDPRQTKLF